MNELNELRRKGATILVAIGWICVLVITANAFFAGTGLMPAALAAAVSIVPTTLVLRGNAGSQARLALGFAYPLYPAIMLWQWSGQHWMLDLHMQFFAAIAMLMLLADWRPVLLAAAVTAVHHLFTNFLAPSLVFPDGSDIERVVLHAVIVVAETAVLTLIARNFETLVIEQAAAQNARERTEELALEERQRAADEQNRVIDQIGSALRALANGDLSLRITSAFPASYEALRRDFNAAAGELDQIVRNVTRSAGQIETGSREIRTATDDLALRTEEQAATLEDITNTLRALNVTVTENATSAFDLQGNVTKARDDALSGSEVVESAVHAMSEIEYSAQEISKIITLIDGIAFQTNLLALNAGVEAARAGEAGKGFAVVATEVRALAQRSADAANDIKALISTSSEQVSRGVRLVGQSGEALMTIVNGIAQINESIGRIATVSQGQAGEIGRINERMGRLDSATQQNAAMVEEGTAAARHLSSEAEAMARLVAHFAVSGEDRAGNGASSGGRLRHAA
ncbi:methyl-accepting chemotaxis protein [Novosphingobium sp. 1949]|uniref:Methyl-accepting chemotaxis protein n=1 Tax=Novosphingobium organovorum TaxID=2930092 RepID=A0ABT0B9A2_9SPHN|nr:methyl-accepting chemotaxis protein [Novosphingobium organovorum]MCJ2181622.1 methyl-accepting chemotaxis protein [Novosphingobium organovorum]